MNDFRKSIGIPAIAVVAMVLTLLATAQKAAALQDTTSKTATQSGAATVNTTVKSGEVVYVSGDHLAVKLPNGEVEHFVVPEDFKFQVEGQDVTIHDLKPGMRLTQTITSTSTPHLVRSVRTIHGTVWHVNPPDMVILKLPDNTNQKYTVPKGQTFDINGQKLDVFHLKKGMTVTATVITESNQTVDTTAQSVTGQAPPAPIETPPEVGALLIVMPAASAEPQQTAAAKPATLPNTASDLPLLVILGAMSIAGWAAFRFSRHTRRSS